MVSKRKNSQRIGILIIAIVMVVSTIAMFAGMMLMTQNDAIDQERAERQQQDMIEEMLASNQPLEGYSAEEFDDSSVDSLEVEILEEGDGPKLEEDSVISANYFGWTSDGTIFDSTNRDGEVNPVEFGLGQVIAGWTEGLSGVREGSVVELTIPSDMAYGSTGSPPVIGPDEPLRFIVEVVEIVEEE